MSITALVICVALLGGLAWLNHEVYSVIPAPMYPPMEPAEGVGSLSAESCAACHVEIAKEWSGSLHALIKNKLRPFQKEGTDRFRWLLEEGWRRLVANKSVGDVGQLLYYLDSGHFVDFLDRYRSDAYEDNTQIFVEAGAATSPEDEALARKQWEWKKLQIAQAAG